MLALGPRPLRLRGPQHRGPPYAADGERGRHVARGRLARRARARRRRAARVAVSQHGGAALGALVSPHATLEELRSPHGSTRGLGTDNIDYRLRQADFRGDRAGARWLGMPVAELGSARPRARRRQLPAQRAPAGRPPPAPGGEEAARAVLKLASVDDDWLMPVAHKAIVRAVAAAGGARADRRRRGRVPQGEPVPAPLDGIAGRRAVGVPRAPSRTSSCRAAARAVLLGNFAQQHAEASQLHALAQELAALTGATLGFLREGRQQRRRGARRARAARADGLNARAMLAEPRRAYLVLHAEAELDCASPVAARAALERAEFVRGDERLAATASPTPTCCCPSRRSPRRRARS